MTDGKVVIDIAVDFCRTSSLSVSFIVFYLFVVLTIKLTCINIVQSP